MHSKMRSIHISNKNYTVPRFRSLPLFWLGVSACLFSLAPCVRAQNLIRNGDFETAPFAPSSVLTYWTVGGTGHMH